MTLNTQVKYFYLSGLLLSRQKKYVEAIDQFLSGSDIIPRDTRTLLEADQKKFEERIVKLLRHVDDPSILKNLFSQHEQSALAGLLIYKLGQSSLKLSQHDDAKSYFKKIISDYPDSLYFSEAMEYLRSISQQKVVDPKAVGVLLPLAGKDSRFARKALTGIGLAFRVFEAKEVSSNVKIIIEDSGNSPEDAVKALEKLFYDHHVVAVIGPLHSKKVEAVTQRAQELGVPLMSLAQKEGIEGDYVFHSAVSLKHQCYEIARHAIKVEGMRRFAVVYPDNRFGQLQNEFFWNAVEELGGEVVAVEQYKPGSVDFNTIVKKNGRTSL